MDHHIQEIALRYYEALDSASSLTCAILLRSKEYDQLALRATDPSDYDQHDNYFRDACANDFLRKLEELPTTIDKKAKAIETWWEAEKSCFRTNRLLSDVLEGEKPSTQFFDLFESLREKTHRILGRLPESFQYRFGPGASYEHRGQRSLLPDKLSAIPTMTNDSWVFLRDVKETAWFRCLNDAPFEHRTMSFDLPVVPGNRFVTVPKDGKTDRGIAIEPTLNIYIQLGLGDAIRKSLKRCGLLLVESQEIHRELARKGSLNDALATIDLSSASDTVAYGLVTRMVPDSWCHLLEASRSPMTELPGGRNVRLEKFSSMGNGYTFELETLLFAAMCFHVAEKLQIQLVVGENFSVYGDDIIVPTLMAPSLLALLRTLGFTPNQKKTFTQGPFRESCGGDFFLGHDVRPIQVKNTPKGPLDWFALHNMIVRRFPNFSSVLDYILEQLPSSVRKLGGETRLGDLVLHGVAPIERVVNSIREVRCLFPILVKIPLNRWDSHTGLASVLYGCLSSGVTPRESTQAFRIGWVGAS